MADPSELVLTSAQATALAGTDDGVGLEYIAENASYFDLDTNNNAVRGRILAAVNALRVVKDAANPSLSYGVFSGRFANGAATVTYAGSTGNALTNDATNYIYLTPAGVLTKNTTGFPATPHIPLATIAAGTSSAAAITSQYDFADITDYRSGALFSLVARPSTLGLASQSLAFGDFTDNGDATGYIDITTQIPASAIVMGWEAVVSTGFTGDTTAVVQVGVAGDLDAFSADVAQSVLAAATVGSASLAAESYLAAATTARVTVTGAGDFGLISAGVMVVTIFYVDLK